MPNYKRFLYIMGNSPTDPNLPLQNLEQFTLPQYGGRVFVDKTNRTVYRELHIYGSEQEQFQKILKKRLALQHPNLAKIQSYSQLRTEGSNICGPSTKRYRLVYNLYAYSLFNEIQTCCKQRRPLPQKQICRIFEGVVSCLEYLHSQGTMHGDVKVSSIFMDRQRGVKLVDSFFLKQGKTSYEVVLQDPKSMSLLAPQQLDLLKLKLFDSVSQISEREMFMVGMSMIEATTIQQGMKCYDLESLRIRDEFFVYMMAQIQSCGYSYQLSNLIMNCVHRNPKERPTFDLFLRQVREIRNYRRL